MIKAAILGFGTVGSGVAQVLEENRKEILRRTGLEIEVKYILDLKDFSGHRYASKFVRDIDTILQDEEIRICCEVMGGRTAAYEYTKKALQAGKSVCTSNKELVEAFGAELFTLAKEHNCNYLYEASVGGGIPIIRNIRSCLAADRIESVMGILNGTTNYMLTKMDEEDLAYEAVLKEAQDRGYAEKDPTADVEGFDTGRKIAILASLMCGRKVSYEDLYIEGITDISKADFWYAKKLGMTIRLLAQGRQSTDQISASVFPCLIPAGHPLYMVKDVYNAVLVHGNMLGDAMFYGAGAGKLPTASAVCADVLALAQAQDRDITGGWSQETAYVLPFGEMQHRFLVRIKKDHAKQAQELFGDTECIYPEAFPEEFACITPKMREKDFQERYEKLTGAISRIRML